MRTKTSLALGMILSVAALAACSSSASDDSESNEAAATEEEQARAALRVLGARLPDAPPSDTTCIACHDPAKMTLRKWASDYKRTVAFLRDETKTPEERIAYMRRNPEDPQSGFAPAKLGILTAGTHFSGNAASVSEERHPNLFKQMRLLDTIFANDADAYAKFRTETLMPVEATYDRLSAGEFEKVLAWVEAAPSCNSATDCKLPKLDDLLQEEARPTTCTDDFTALKEHVRAVKSVNWAAVNKGQRMPMFACTSENSLECFNQQKDGKDIFPNADATEYGKGWSPGEDTIRVLRALEYKTHFWMRSSADGRFVANGGGPRIDGTGAVIADLQAALDPAGPKTRDIGVNASYDPDFFPAGQGFMFQGGGKYCSMSLLKDLSKTKISLDEPQCSKLDGVGLYQTVGQVSADNSISDIFVVNGKFASDNPGLTASDKDLILTAGPEAALTVRVGVARGNDADDGYQIKQTAELRYPFKGDIMMSRTGQLTGSRVAGEQGMLGYAVDKLTFVPGGEGYRFSNKQIGRICMKGNKANFSFDERFLATHHYLTREDFESDSAWAAYKDKGAADIYVADFVTGKKQRITRMKPGQFAIFPHYRSDGWLYFLVRDANTKKEYAVASDHAIKAIAANPF